MYSRPKLWGFEKRCGKIGQNTLTVTFFKQLPRAQIGQKFKNLCAHQIANYKTIVLTSENVQKVHSRPKLLAFEKKIVVKLGTMGTNFDKNQKLLCPSDRELPGDYFGH